MNLRKLSEWCVRLSFTCVAIHAIGQNAIDGQTVNPGEDGAGNQTLSTYITGSMTKRSPGQFNYDSAKSWQTNGSGWGTAAEYRKRIRGRNYGGILFSDTPTNSTLYFAWRKPYSWPIRRYEFDVLWTHEFAHERHRLVPYVTSGVGAIALNGGSSQSGWDHQGALVGGAGGDVRLSRLVTLRVGFTTDWLKASTYSDPDYRSTGTIMVEPRIGLVWGFGLPHPVDTPGAAVRQSLSSPQ